MLVGERDLFYAGGRSDAPGADRTGLVSKVDLGLQQFLGEFLCSWRVLEGPVAGWICWRDLDIPISASRWVYRPITWQSMQQAPNW